MKLSLSIALEFALLYPQLTSSLIQHTHLPYKLLDGAVDGIGAEFKLGGDALRLLCEGHAALGVCVESASRLVMVGLALVGAADGRLFIEGGRGQRIGGLGMLARLTPELRFC